MQASTRHVPHHLCPRGLGAVAPSRKAQCVRPVGVPWGCAWRVSRRAVLTSEVRCGCTTASTARARARIGTRSKRCSRARFSFPGARRERLPRARRIARALRLQWAGRRHAAGVALHRGEHPAGAKQMTVAMPDIDDACVRILSACFTIPPPRRHPCTHMRTHTRARAHTCVCAHARTRKHTRAHARIHTAQTPPARARAHADGGFDRDSVAFGGRSPS